WAAFAVLVIAIGIVFLAACDLNIRPLFGLRYCVSRASQPDLQAERERERNLRERIHEAELRLAQLPVCTPSGKRPGTKETEPKQKEAEPKQKETEPKQKEAEPKQKEAELKVPTKLEDLRGCWQSVRGDIDLVTDDAEAKPVGKV